MKTKYILYLAAAIVVFLLVKKYLGKKQDEKGESEGNGGGGGGGGSLPNSVINISKPGFIRTGRTSERGTRYNPSIPPSARTRKPK